LIEHLLPTRWDQRYAHSSRTRTADANAAVSTRSTRGPSVTTPGCAAAEFGVYGPEGEWLIEGHGVDPDRVVDNLPHATFLGEDAQLEAAIDYLKKRIRESERRLISPRELTTPGQLRQSRRRPADDGAAAQHPDRHAAITSPLPHPA
jgi:hypothetical protein